PPGGGPVPVPPQPNIGPVPPQQFGVGQGGHLIGHAVGGQQAQPVPVQAQPQPGVPVRPGGGPFGRRPPVPQQQLYPPGTIVVVDGKPVDVPTFYSGAIRFRGLPADPNVFGKPADGEQLFILEVTPEPKL